MVVPSPIRCGTLTFSSRVVPTSSRRIPDQVSPSYEKGPGAITAAAHAGTPCYKHTLMHHRARTLRKLGGGSAGVLDKSRGGAGAFRV